MVMDPGGGLDLACDRAVGMGAISLRPLGFPERTRLGLDPWLRIGVPRLWLSRLSLAASPSVFLQQSHSTWKLHRLVSTGTWGALAPTSRRRQRSTSISSG